MIKTIIFDWGGVLIKHPVEDLFEYTSINLGADKEQIENVFSRYAGRLERGQISLSDFAKSASNSLGLEESFPENLWGDALRAVIRPIEGMLELVASVKQAGYSTGFLSNTEKPAKKLYEELGYSGYFDFAVLSCDEGYAKPEPEIYKIAIERAGNEASEIIFIDDKEENIAAANAAGINGIHFTGIDKLKDELKTRGIKV